MLSCCFAYSTCFFAVFVDVAVVVTEAPYCRPLCVPF